MIVNKISGIVFPERKGASCETLFMSQTEKNEPIIYSDEYSEKKDVNTL